MKFILDRIADEPVAFAGLVRIAIYCAIAFGLSWTPAQVTAFMALVEAAAVFFTRKVVTPNTTVTANAALAIKAQQSSL